MNREENYLIFNVKGETLEQLQTTLELAFSVFGHNAEAWKIDKNKGLVLYWTEGDEGVNRFPFSMNEKNIFPIVAGFLASQESEVIELGENDADDLYSDGSDLGWRVYSENWGHIGDSDYAFLAITPSYHCWSK